MKKTVIDPRILKNLVHNEYAPNFTFWEEKMLELRNNNRTQKPWVVGAILFAICMATLPFVAPASAFPVAVVFALLFVPLLIVVVAQAFRNEKHYDAQWHLILSWCKRFRNAFDLDVHDRNLSYEYLLGEVRERARRLALHVVELQDQHKRQGRTTEAGRTQVALYKDQFGKVYDLGIQFFSYEFSECKGYSYFFDPAEQHVEKMKTSVMVQ